MAEVIVHPCNNFGVAQPRLAWMSNYVPVFYVDVIIYPYQKIVLSLANLCKEKRALLITKTLYHTAMFVWRNEITFNLNVNKIRSLVHCIRTTCGNYLLAVLGTVGEPLAPCMTSISRFIFCQLQSLCKFGILERDFLLISCRFCVFIHNSSFFTIIFLWNSFYVLDNLYCHFPQT